MDSELFKKRVENLENTVNKLTQSLISQQTYNASMQKSLREYQKYIIGMRQCFYLCPITYQVTSIKLPKYGVCTRCIRQVHISKLMTFPTLDTSLQNTCQNSMRLDYDQKTLPDTYNMLFIGHTCIQSKNGDLISTHGGVDDQTIRLSVGGGSKFHVLLDNSKVKSEKINLLDDVIVGGKVITDCAICYLCLTKLFSQFVQNDVCDIILSYL
jgi:RNA polymerase-binding transcription factor DksA